MEPYVDENDRLFASNVQKRIYKTVEKIQETAQELYDASKSKQSKSKDLLLRKMEDELEIYARHLNNDQLYLMQSVGSP